MRFIFNTTMLSFFQLSYLERAEGRGMLICKLDVTLHRKQKYVASVLTLITLSNAVESNLIL